MDWIGNTTHLIALLFFHQPDGLLAQLVLGDALAVRRQLTLQNFHPRQKPVLEIREKTRQTQFQKVALFKTLCRINA